MDDISNFNILKRICRVNKLVRVGSYWFDNENKRGKLEILSQVLLFSGFYTLCILEVIEIISYTYPVELHGDAFALCIIHLIIFARFHSLHYNKKNIRKLIQEIAMDDGKFKIKDEKLLKRQFKKIKFTISLLSVVISIALLGYVVEGCRRYFINNKPFTLLPIFWPHYGDTSSKAVAFHFLFYFVLNMLSLCMISADTLVVSHLIMVGFKFVNLRYYFDNLQEDFISTKMTTIELRNICLDGVLEHRKLIRLTHDIRKCFGPMMSLQVAQGSIIIFLLLVNTALSQDMKIAAMAINFGFIMGVTIQLAMYLWNAGEVTYQASLIPDAIFHCGWHLRSIRDAGGRDLRRMVLMGCAQAQRPLILKAFGIQTLSYDAFVAILKMSYSVFAVLR